jgi:hypothetical protein
MLPEHGIVEDTGLPLRIVESVSIGPVILGVNGCGQFILRSIEDADSDLPESWYI